MMKDLTALIVSRNDSDVISSAIKSLQGFADEIIVIDSNNDNETTKIVKQLKANVVKHPFKDFSDQRNFAILQAYTKWVFYLDSDERVTPEFKEEVEKTIRNFDENSNIGGFFVKRKTFFYGKDWGLEDNVQRLFLKSKFIEWKGVVHETPIIKGDFGTIISPINHLTHRNLSQMIRKTNEWSEYEARLRFDSNHPRMKPWRFVRVMASEFFNSFFRNKGYSNGTHGLIEAIYQAFSIFITYAKLWEMQEGEDNI